MDSSVGVMYLIVMMAYCSINPAFDTWNRKVGSIAGVIQICDSNVGVMLEW